MKLSSEIVSSMTRRSLADSRPGSQVDKCVENGADL